MQQPFDEQDWGDYAQDCARIAHEENFQSRRGCCTLENDWGEKVLVFYDNNPYQAGPRYRERQLCRIRQRIDQLGLREVGFATWPPEGQEDAGYTLALLVGPWSEEMQQRVVAVCEEEIRRTVQELSKL
jgi:hypothetical protein